MSDFVNELGRRAPQLALAILAGRQGGMEGLGAFQGGMLEAQQRQDALARQTQLDDERRQQQASVEARAVRTDQRADEAQRFQRIQEALRQLQQYEQQQGETASDPAAAENALLGRASSLESLLSVPQGQLSGFVPNMAPVVSRGVRHDARTLLADTDAIVKKANKDAAVDDTTTSFKWVSVPPRVQKALVERGHPAGQEVKPSQLSELAAMPTLNVPKPKPPPPTAGSFEDYISAQPERRAEIESARKRYMQADDRPPQGATVVIQTVDAQGNPVTRIVPKTAGAEFVAPPTGAQRQQSAENTAVLAGLNRLRELAPTTGALSVWVGPVQGRVNSLKLTTPGVDVDPKMAEFFAETAAIKNRMIRAITGAQMSEPEAKRIMSQLPDIGQKPGVFLARMAATERNLEALNAAMAAKANRNTGAVEEWVRDASGKLVKKGAQ